MTVVTAFTVVPCLPFRAPARRPSRRPRRFRLAPAARLPPSVASLTDERTGARIFLVGCVHGSKLSADDVNTMLDKTAPDAVILELCEARLKSLKVIIDQDFDESKVKSRRRTFRQISSTFGGAGPAIVAFVLEAVYKLQVISGVQPGVEFAEPIKRASSWKLVCGDAPARDTVRELYSVFTNPMRSFRESLSSVEDVVSRLIFPPKSGVNMLGIFLAEPRRLRELAKMTLPALLISGVLTLAGNAGALALESAPAMNMLNDPGSLFSLLVSIGQTLFVSYIIVSTLQFFKALIADRDRILAQSIMETASDLQSTRRTPVVICAVVGLLHVNGIVRQIQGQGTRPHDQSTQ